MCGIVGYVGSGQRCPIIFAGLRRLEYRGHHSAGIAVLDGDRTRRCRAVGKLDNLELALAEKPLLGSIGIGHTRWATHGKPTYINAHPAPDCKGKIFVVHNGIIENFAELKAELEAEGHEFPSETDTEVLPHLVEKYFRGRPPGRGQGCPEAHTGRLRDGHVLTAGARPARGARLNAPLVSGSVADSEYYIASDITAIIRTRDACPSWARARSRRSPRRGESHRSTARRSSSQFVHVDWDPARPRKAGSPLHAERDSREATGPADAMRGRLGRRHASLSTSSNPPTRRCVRSTRSCSSAWARPGTPPGGEYLIEDWAGSRPSPITLGVSLSRADRRSDEPGRGDVPIRRDRGHAGLRWPPRSSGAMTVDVINVFGAQSPATPRGDLPALRSGDRRRLHEDLPAHGQLLCSRSAWPAAQAPGARGRGSRWSRRCGAARPGRRRPGAGAADPAFSRAFQPVARLPLLRPRHQLPGRAGGRAQAEGDLLHPRRGLPGGELKHGPIALIDEDFPVVASRRADQRLRQGEQHSSRSWRGRVRDRRGHRGRHGDRRCRRSSSCRRRSNLCPILTVMPLQLFAYHVAARRGRTSTSPATWPSQ